MEEYSHTEIGKKIRVIRLAKKITINEVSNKTGLTPSFISQFERGITKASVGSIVKIVDAIGVKMSTLFANNTQSVESPKKPFIVRKKERSTLTYPGLQGEVLKEYLLTDPKGKMEVYISEIEPGASSTDKYSHGGKEEFILVIDGVFEIELGDGKFVLDKGDAITLDSSTLHSWKNISDAVTKVLWIIYR